MKIRKEVDYGSFLPRGYGVAWADYQKDVRICYPVPLNWIFRWARSFWHWLQFPGISWLDRYQAAQEELRAIMIPDDGVFWKIDGIIYHPAPGKDGVPVYLNESDPALRDPHRNFRWIVDSQGDWWWVAFWDSDPVLSIPFTSGKLMGKQK